MEYYFWRGRDFHLFPLPMHTPLSHTFPHAIMRVNWFFSRTKFQREGSYETETKLWSFHYVKPIDSYPRVAVYPVKTRGNIYLWLLIVFLFNPPPRCCVWGFFVLESTFLQSWTNHRDKLGNHPVHQILEISDINSLEGEALPLVEEECKISC